MKKNREDLVEGIYLENFLDIIKYVPGDLEFTASFGDTYYIDEIQISEKKEIYYSPSEKEYYCLTLYCEGTIEAVSIKLKIISQDEVEKYRK